MSKKCHFLFAGNIKNIVYYSHVCVIEQKNNKNKSLNTLIVNIVFIRLKNKLGSSDD